MNRADIMIDLETLGTEPDSPIIQIAAARFDIATGDIIDTFNQVCGFQFEHNITITIDTLKWWLNTDNELLKDLLNQGKNSTLSMIESFYSWITNQGEIDERYLWGNGILFDNNMIKTHFQNFYHKYPILYRNDRDMRTIVDLAAMKLGLESATEFSKLHSDENIRAHDAMNDVKTQVHIIHEAYKVIMGGANEQVS